MTSPSRRTLVQTVLSQVDDLAARRRRAFCAHELHREVSLPQMHILMTLQERGPMTVSELAQFLRISLPSTSSILDRMEEHRFIERVRDAADRRVVRVAITEHGAAVVEEMIGPKRQEMQSLLESMTDDELRAVIAGIQAIQQAILRREETMQAS